MSDVSKTLAERGGRYGAFKDHAKISQGLQKVLFDAPNWSKLDPDMRQALCTICDKIARILNGDPYYADNWHDIQGYARLVESRILELEKKAEEKVDDREDNWESEHSQVDWTLPDIKDLVNPDSNYRYLIGDPEDSFSIGSPKTPTWSTTANDKSDDSHYDVGNYRG